MIILSEKQYQDLVDFILKNKADIPIFAQIMPIKIKTGYMLPESILNDANFLELRKKLTIDVQTLEIREVNESELIESNLSIILKAANAGG